MFSRLMSINNHLYWLITTYTGPPVKQLEEENQKLRDENNRLKGELGKPDIKASKKRELKKDHSSEKERKTPQEHSKTSKKETIKVDREEIVFYPHEELPADAEFKGYEEIIVQDILLKTDNVLFRKEKYYSPLLGKTFTAPLTKGYEGELVQYSKNWSSACTMEET